MKKILLITVLALSVIITGGCAKKNHHPKEIDKISSSLNMQGMHYNKAGLMKKSRRTFVSAIAVNPQNKDAIYNLAVSSFYEKNYIESSAMLLPLYASGYSVDGYPLSLLLAESLCREGLVDQGLDVIRASQKEFKKSAIVSASRITKRCIHKDVFKE